MLGLMCNIYRGENYIPTNRPEVYEKSATMLFEKWDTRRGIKVALPISAHIRPAMTFLASAIYTNETFAGKVAESTLIELTKSYLLNRKFSDPDEAEQAAREFVDFCTDRAWVFTDVGTTATGEKLFQFTHRTFLEYFTASHIVRTHPSTSKLQRYLTPRVEKVEWDVVAQLCVQIHNAQVEGSADELLGKLLILAEHSDDQIGTNLLSFVARVLSFVVPNERTVAAIPQALVPAGPWSHMRSHQKAAHPLLSHWRPLLMSAQRMRKRRWRP